MTATYTAIATANGNGSSGTISFTSIPSIYTDLILVQQGSASTTGNDMSIQINGDTGTNYSRNYFLGAGSGNGSAGYTANASAFVPCGAYNDSMLIVHFNNYSNTTTYKPMIARANQIGNYTVVTTGKWRSTSAINRIDVICSGNWTTSAVFTIYGIKAA